MTENESVQAVCTSVIAAILAAGTSQSVSGVLREPEVYVDAAHALMGAAERKAKLVSLEIFKSTEKSV